MRLSLAALSLVLATTSVLATPPPDMIDALEAAKNAKHKREVPHALHRRGDGNGLKEKKWVVLPSSSLPDKLRAPPRESIFKGESSEVPKTALPTNRIHRVIQKRDAANATVSTAPAAATPAPADSSESADPATSSASVNPFDPFTWKQGVTNQYNSTKEQFDNLSSLSKVGLAAIITVAALFLLAILVCACKISRARTRRRKEKLRIKAEAHQAQLSRSNTNSSRSTASTSPSSVLSTEKKRGDGVFGWMKKQTRTGDAGEAMPEHDRLREMQQSSLTWDPKRAKSWDARAKGLGQSSPGRSNLPEAPQAPGGSMKTRNRSWAGPK